MNSRVRPIFALGSTMFPVGVKTPVAGLNCELLGVPRPMSSLAWTMPS